ncbi:MAG: iron complex outermembrane recepter protein [Candidatus Nitrotoga sp. SPKER]|nr:MAG: iron complex outermembrane recepter protein [Candidatus Nitrotoga sp. SPKER]
MIFRHSFVFTAIGSHSRSCISPTVPVRNDTSPTFKVNVLMLFISCVLAGQGVFTSNLALAVEASSSAVGKDYTISAGRLSDVLAEFAATAGVQLVFDPKMLAGMNSSGLQGRYTVRDGFTKLLTGSSYELVDAGGGWSLVKQTPGDALNAAAEPMLPVVVVKASPERENATGPVVGYVAKHSRTATKTDIPILEIPQSISVIGQEEIAARGAQDMARALTYTPGVVSETYGPAGLLTDYIAVRGFEIPHHLDGMQLPTWNGNNSAWATETWGLERIEVLKGPASVLYGQAAPGGLLNMVSKRPTNQSINEARITYGSFNRRQAAVDLSGPVSTNSDFAYRLVALARDTGDQFDFVQQKRTYIAPSLMWTPSADTRLTLLSSFLNDDQSGSRGALPIEGTLRPNPNGTLPRNRTDTDPSDRFQRRQYSVGYELEHALNNGVSFQSKLRYADVRFRQNDFTYSTGWITNADGNPSDYRTVRRSTLSFPGQHRALNADNSVRAEFNVGAVKHRLLAGVDYQRLRQSYQLGFSDVPDVDLYTPVYLPFTKPDLILSIGQRSDQLGLYIQDQMKLGRVILTMSGRHDRVETSSISGTVDSPTLDAQKDRAFTGRVGLGYLFDSGVSPYASYSTSFRPAVGLNALGATFEPTTGEQIEAGIKYQPSGRNVSATASVFRLVQQNMLTIDPVNVGFQKQAGEVRVDGIELEGKANLASGLDMTLAAAWLDPVVTRSNDGIQGNRLGNTPKVQASSWLNYRLPFGMEMGLGVRHMGSTYNASNNVSTPAYTLVDAAMHMNLVKLNPALRGARLSLTVNNLSDKHYFNACLESTCYSGAKRTVNMALGYIW